MGNVDKRVVEMQFDNQHFEKNVQTSVQSLDKLKQSLDLEKSAKSLAALDKAGRSFSLASIADGVSAISSRFSALGIVGVTALQNIANSAINAGKRMAESLTIAPIKTGFSEYETQMNAVQTILSNTGDEMKTKGLDEAQSLELVNAKLDELNEYADKTIYNFAEMAKNIGTFTAAGVDLDSSVSAIKGIANLAAASGADSQRASTAMYQLSQALSTGTVRLMDWNSVVNAGMGGEVFQKALKRTAKAMGVVGKEAQETFAQLQSDKISFRDSLSSGWLSSDILTATLGQLSLDFDTLAESIAKEKNISIEAAREMAKLNTKTDLVGSGYTSTEADEIIALAENASNAATKVKTFTQLISTMREAAQSGWTQTWELIVGDFLSAKSLLSDINDYFGKVIGASADSRNAIVSDWVNLGGRQDLIDGFWNIVHAIENIVTLFKDSFETFFPPTTADRLFAITAAFKTFAEKIKALTEDSEKMATLQRIFKGIAAALDIVRTAVSWVWNWFKKLLGVAEPAGGSMLEFVASIGDFIVGIRDSIKNSETFQTILASVGKAIESVKNFVVSIGKAVVKVFEWIWGKVKGSGVFTELGKTFQAFVGGIPAAIETLKSWGKAIVDYFQKSEFLQKAWQKIKDFAGPAIEKIKTFAGQFGEALKAFFGVDTSGVEGFWDKLKARFAVISESAQGLFAKLKDKVSKVWESLKTFFADLFGKGTAEKSLDLNKPSIFVSLFEQIKKLDWKTILGVVTGAYAGTKILSFLKGFSALGKGLKSIGEFFKSFQKTGKVSFEFMDVLKKQDSLGNNMIKIAGAIALLVGVIVVISKMSDDALIKGLTVLGIMALGLIALAGAFKLIGSSDTKNVLKLAIALALLTIPVLVFGNMSIDKLTQGIVTILGLLIGLAMFTKSSGNLGKNSGLIATAIALNLLIIPIKVLGAMDVDQLAQGMMAVMGLLISLSLFMTYSKGLGKSSGLIATAIALNLLIIPLKILGAMDVVQLGLGLAAIGAILVGLSLFMAYSKGLGKSTGLIATAIALNLLIIPIKVLGAMDVTQLAQGMTALLGLLIGLTLFLKYSKGLGKSTGLIATAIALNLLIIPLKVLGAMDPGQLGLGLTAIGALLIGLGIFNKKSKSFGKSSGLIAMALALNLLVIPIKILGKMDQKELSRSVIAIGSLLIAIGIFNKLSGGADMKQTASQMVSLTGIAALMVGFAAALTMVKDIPWQTMAAFSAGILAVVTAAVAATLLLKNVNPGDAAKASAALAIIATGLGAAIAIIAGFVGNAAEGLSDNAVSIASNLQLYSDMAAKVDYGAIGESITAIKDIAGMMVDVGGRDIGKFNDFSSQLTLLGARLASFNWSVSGIAIGGADNAVAMVEDIDTIGGKMVEMQNKGYDFDTLAKAMMNFGSGLELYATAAADADALMKDVVGGKAVSADSLSSLFTEMARVNLPQNTIDKVRAFGQIGDAGLGDFALGLTAIGSAVQSYSTSIKGIGFFDALKSGIVLTMINDLQKNLPVEGNTVFDWFNGGTKQTLAEFSEMLIALGGGISIYSDSLSNYDHIKATTSTDNLKQLLIVQSDLMTQTNKIDGLIIFGKSGTLQELGSTLNILGTGFNEYITNLAQFGDKQDLVSAATTALQGLAAIQVSLMGFYTATGEIDIEGRRLETNDTDLGKFGNNLKSLGESFKTFVGTITGVTVPTNMEDVRKTVDDFANIAVKLNGVTMSYDLSNQLYWFGVHIRDFFSDDNGIGNVTVDNQKVLDVTTAVDKIADIAVKLNGMTGVDFVFLQTMLNGLSTLIIPDFAISGADAADALLTGIQNGVATLPETTRKAANGGAAAAKTTYPTWHGAGAYLGRGLGNGILSMARSVQNSAISVSSGAIRSIQMIWQVHSPSRVGNDLGMNLDLGIAGGLDTYAKVVNQSATGMGNSAVESARMALNRMTTNLTDGIDTTPTIRPVIDMSNVQSGVSAINSMFNANRSLSAGSFAGAAINRNAANLNIDGAQIMSSSGNKDVVEAIQTLTDRFDSLSTAVASMKLVLDNGTLVGQLGPNMDKQLGVLAGRRERGN